MKTNVEKLIKHLKTQIAVSDSMGADFCYITKNEARKCLELAEAEDTLIMTPVHAETEQGEGGWLYVCGECHARLNPHDNYCRQCGRKIEWK